MEAVLKKREVKLRGKSMIFDSKKVNEKLYVEQVKNARSQRDQGPTESQRMAHAKPTLRTSLYPHMAMPHEDSPGQQRPRWAEFWNGSWWRGAAKQGDNKDDLDLAVPATVRHNLDSYGSRTVGRLTIIPVNWDHLKVFLLLITRKFDTGTIKTVRISLERIPKA